MSKEKHIPETVKQRSFSQKWLVVLIIMGVGLALMAAAIVVKSPEKSKDSELLKNKVTSKIIAMPERQPEPQAPPLVDSKEKNPQFHADQAAAAATSGETPAPSPMESKNGQDFEIKFLKAGDSQMLNPKADNFETAAPEVEDAAMPEADDSVTQDLKAENFKMLSAKADNSKTAAPEAENSAMPDPKAGDSKMQNSKADAAKAETPSPQKPATQREAVQPSTQPTMDIEERPFTVQVGAFRVDVYANRMAARLEQRYYRSFVHEVIGKDQRPLYLVCFGRFKTRKAASEAVMEFIVKENMDAVVALLEPR